ncbi:hypothetical protein [Shouchella lehensis]|uniref:Uncharacterized protein n=1 Tax=Shouchella lehensis G1 TaxID=1246626 RepID=A0A060M271_9BACI|nr:hypothetical protein [Shouchella lehensis]AIC96105.1 hypothetical protein BleG1_3558 [Shouchella lehensis G1]
MKKLLTGLVVVLVLGSIGFTANAIDTAGPKHEHSPASFGLVETFIKHEH